MLLVRLQELQDRLSGAESRAAGAEAVRDAAGTKAAQTEAALHSQLAFMQVRCFVHLKLYDSALYCYTRMRACIPRISGHRLSCARRCACKSNDSQCISA